MSSYVTRSAAMLATGVLLSACAVEAPDNAPVPVEAAEPSAASSAEPATSTVVESDAAAATTAPPSSALSPGPRLQEFPRLEIHDHHNSSLVTGPHAVATHLNDDSWQFFSSSAELPSLIFTVEEPDRVHLRQEVGVQQDPSAAPSILTTSLEQTKPEGLTQITTEFVFRLYDDNAQEIATQTFPAPSDEVTLRHTGLYGDFATLAMTHRVDDEEREVHVGIDLISGSKVWERTCPGGDINLDANVTSGHGIYAFACGTDVVGLEVTTGADAWVREVEQTDGAFAGGNESASGLTPLLTSKDYFATYDEGIWALDDGVAVVGPATYEDMLYDPRGDLMVFWSIEGMSDRTTLMDVVDLATGDTVLSITEEDGLGFFVPQAIYDDHLWIAFDGGGLAIVEARTGATDPLSPAPIDGMRGHTNLPLVSGDTWVLLAEDVSSGNHVNVFYSDPSGDIALEDLPATQVITSSS